jgi:hypothetical protein
LKGIARGGGGDTEEISGRRFLRRIPRRDYPPFIDEDGSVWYSVYCGDTSFHLGSLEEARKEIDEELDRLGLDYGGQDE